MYVAKYYQITKAITWCTIGIIAMLLVCALTGCKTKKLIDEKQDSVRVEYKEVLVKVPVTVYVEVPVENKERFSKDSVSHLETSFAWSDAKMVWIDGVAFLNHTLSNKPQKIAKTDSVPVKYKTFYKIIYRTRYKTRIEYVEKKLNWMQQTLMWSGGISILAIIIFLIIKFKKYIPFIS